MAEVDFSHARIEPFAYTPVGSTPYDPVNPTYRANASLNPVNMFASPGGGSVGSATVTQLISQQKQLMYLYQGTFSASGTEFYLLNYSGSGYYSTSWKISNISFNSGDTFVFQINANLVCN